jgi:hypothetical protein
MGAVFQMDRAKFAKTMLGMIDDGWRLHWSWWKKCQILLSSWFPSVFDVPVPDMLVTPDGRNVSVMLGMAEYWKTKGFPK